MGERIRGGFGEGEHEHLASVQGVADPGETKVQFEPGVATTSSSIVATAPAFKFTQQQRSRAVPGAAAVLAADPRTLRVQEEFLHSLVRSQCYVFR